MRASPIAFAERLEIGEVDVGWIDRPQRAGIRLQPPGARIGLRAHRGAASGPHQAGGGVCEQRSSGQHQVPPVDRRGRIEQNGSAPVHDLRLIRAGQHTESFRSAIRPAFTTHRRLAPAAAAGRSTLLCHCAGGPAALSPACPEEGAGARHLRLLLHSYRAVHRGPRDDAFVVDAPHSFDRTRPKSTGCRVSCLTRRGTRACYAAGWSTHRPQKSHRSQTREEAIGTCSYSVLARSALLLVGAAIASATAASAQTPPHRGERQVRDARGLPRPHAQRDA